jgi:hypothetical protein
MQNITMSVKGNTLTIVVDLSKKGELSKSGKSHLIATTGGSVDIPGAPGAKLGLNIFKPVG